MIFLQWADVHPPDGDSAPGREERQLPGEQPLDSEDLRLRAVSSHGRRHLLARTRLRWHAGVDGPRAHPQRALYREMRHLQLRRHRLGALYTSPPLGRRPPGPGHPFRSQRGAAARDP